MKSPMLVILTIPVTLIISILVFYLLHISINIISLSGLVLGIGMMVDNSIIVIDNITARWIRGSSWPVPSRRAPRKSWFPCCRPC